MPKKPKPTKNDLSYFRIKEREIACPHCKTKLILGSPMDKIILARRTCPKCEKDFLIDNDQVRAA